MCKKFDFIVEKMSDEAADELWNTIINFIADQGLHVIGISEPCDVDIFEEVTNVNETDS